MSLERKVQATMKAKRNPTLDTEAQEWIENVLGEKFPSGVSYEDALKDGIILCKLMNKIQPGAIKKITTKGGPYALRENAELFQRAASAFGVPDSELFQAVDLFEQKNIAQVTLAVFALARQAQKKGFSGPTLGPHLSEENKRNFTDDQLKAGQGVIGLQAGTNKGANQSGQNFGLTRHM